MLRNYLVVAIRAFRRRLGFAFINVFGLGVGIACCAVIALYVWGELSYDRFHEDADLVYRVESTFGDVISLATVNYPFVSVLQNEYDQYPIATFWRAAGNGAVRRGDVLFRESDVLYANQAVFEVFAFRLERGDEATALSEPYNVVLSREVARKYFGDEDPIGQQLQLFGNYDVTVTGILASPAGPTHIPLTILISWPTLDAAGWSQKENWSANNTFTYIRFPSTASANAVGAALPDLIERYAGDNWPGSTLSLRPLPQIHLYSKHTGELSPGGNPAYVTLFSIVALFILLLAGVNFVNLSTARSLERAREVGVRKSLGAGAGELGWQFMIEAVVLAAIGLAVAVLLISLAMPVLDGLVGRPLMPNRSAMLVGALVGAACTVAIGLGGGLYPAVALTRFQPVEVLRGRFSTGRGGARLRQALVIFQFSVAVVLLIGTFVVYGQLQHLRTADLGFDEGQVIALRGPGAPTSQRLAFFEALEGESSVQRAASLGEELPAELRGGGSIWVPGFVPAENEGVPVFARSVTVSADFFETMGVGFVAGRGFRAGSAADSAGVIVNEAAARMLMAQMPGEYGAVEELIGVTIRTWGQREIVGVAKDFHVTSLHSPVVPMTFFMEHIGVTYVVRTAPAAVTPAIRAIREHWASFFPDAPLEYRFVDDAFGAAYRAEEQLGRLALIFSALAILVACLGLFGLAAYAAEQRRKEIGVRKVLGASVASVVMLLSKEFVRLVAVAVLIGVPLAWYGASYWLENFPSRLELGPEPFLAAGALALTIALATVAGQALRAALNDPVHSLRTE